MKYLLLLVLFASPALADERIFTIPGLNFQAFVDSAAAQGIAFSAAFSSDTPEGAASYGVDTLTLDLFESPVAPTQNPLTKQWMPGRSTVPDLMTAWIKIETILGVPPQ